MTPIGHLSPFVTLKCPYCDVSVSVVRGSRAWCPKDHRTGGRAEMKEE